MAIETFVFFQPRSSFDDRFNYQQYPIAALFAVGSLVPKQIPVEFIFDDGRELNQQMKDVGIPLATALIGLTGTTSAAHQMENVARQTIDGGGNLIVGGIDVSQRTDKWIDLISTLKANNRMAIILGEIEGGSFKQAVDDLLTDRRLKNKYFTSPTNLTNPDLPPDNVISKTKDIVLQRISHARGCPMNPRCEFCGISATAGSGLRVRPPEISLAEFNLRNLLQGGNFQVMFTADSIGSPHDMIFWRQLEELNPHFASFVQADLATMEKNYKLWTILNSIGPTTVAVGFESIFRDPLSGIKRGVANLDPMVIIHEFRQKYPNIAVQTNIIMGLDIEPPGDERFEKTANYIEKLQPDRVAIQIQTPYETTQLKRRLDREKRILDIETSHYNGQYLVYRLKATDGQGRLVDENHDKFLQGVEDIKKQLLPKILRWSKFITTDLDFKSSWPVVV